MRGKNFSGGIEPHQGDCPQLAFIIERRQTEAEKEDLHRTVDFMPIALPRSGSWRRGWRTN